MHRGFVALALALVSTTALAQSPFFTEDFDAVAAGTFPTGWSADAPTGTPLTGWDVDDTPAVPGGTLGPGVGYNIYCFDTPPDVPAPSAVTHPSAPNALNFNNGAGLSSGGLPTGVARSPLITITDATGVTLTFADHFECISCDLDPVAGGLGTDQRFVEILDASGAVILSAQLIVDAEGDGSALAGDPGPPFFVSASPLIDACGDGATREGNVTHTHTMDLGSLTPGDYRLSFRFNQTGEFPYAAFGATPPVTEDDVSGWFVDDISLNCPTPDVAGPAIPTLLLPLDGACVTSPILFDWSDVTDTGPCGPSTVTYTLQIDTVVTFPAPTTFAGIPTSDITLVGPPGTFFWRVSAQDASGNTSGFSAPFTFDNEIPVLPLPPDTLFVNEPVPGAQVGDAGFVDPIVVESPVFSAIYRDPNCTDTAVQYRLQISTDPLFGSVVFDSGPTTLSPTPKDSRTPDLTIPINLSRDTVYFWRIQLADALGFGGFSASQSFRIGDDFEFGVRPGSSNHSRRCWVATAAWGSPTATPVASLQEWRSETLERAASGRAASRGYHTVGRSVASGIGRSPAVRAALAPAVALSGTAGMLAAAALLLAFVTLGVIRSR